ncbi:MAG: secondary thiamine-phosphate synthase enzyme YjbQ [Halodesulfurarchaeum sp.]
MRKTTEIQTESSRDVIEITEVVQDALPGTASDGRCTVFVPHTTAGVIVNEAESRLLADIESVLEDLIPDGGEYRHDRIDDNAAAHLRTSLLGSDVTVPVSSGDLDLGRWQSILFVEGDGPRQRTVDILVP